MKKRILSIFLTLIMTLSLCAGMCVTAAEGNESQNESTAVSFEVHNEKEFLHALDCINWDAEEHAEIRVLDSFTIYDEVEINNTDIVLESGVTLTANATMNIYGSCSFEGVDEAVFDETNLTMTTEPTAMIKCGANVQLIRQTAGAMLTLRNVVIDGGAVWCTDASCEDSAHIATNDADHAVKISETENDAIIENIGRQIHNKGITSDNTLIYNGGQLTITNTIFQNTAYDKVQGEGALVFVQSEVNMTNTVMRNCQTARGRAVGFYGWGKVVATNFEAYGNMMEFGRGANCGILFTDWGFAPELREVNIHNNACTVWERGLIAWASDTSFYSGKIENNLAAAFLTHWGGTLKMYGGSIKNNAIGVGYSGTSGFPAGYAYFYGGEINHNDRDFNCMGMTRLYFYGGNFDFCSDSYCTGNIYFSGDGDNPLVVTNPDMEARGFWWRDRGLKGPLTGDSKIVLSSFDDTIYIYGSNYTITEDDFSRIVNNTGKTLYLDKTANAIYSGTATTITLDANGGACDTTTLNKYYPNSDSDRYRYNSQYGELPVPTKDGAVFAGWYTEKDAGTQVTATSNIPKQPETTLYAHWSTDLSDCTTAAGYTGTYDGNPHSITVNTDAGASVTYCETEDGAYSEANPAYTNAGTYTVYYKVSKAGYADFTGSAAVTINKKTVAIPTGAALTANGEEQTGVEAGDDYVLSGTYRATDAGNYEAIAKLNDNVNTTWTDNTTDEKTILWTINAAPSEKENVTLIFEKDTENQSVDLEDSYVNAASGAPAGGTIMYSSNKTNVATVAENGAVTPILPGTVKITASYAGDDTHNAASASYWLTITSDDTAYHCVADQEVKAPTCEDDGYTAGRVCTICGYVFLAAEPIPATGHDYQYTASGNVITGICSHDDSHVITATINAPASVVGEATVVYSENWPADAKDLAISYTINGINKTASITYCGATASITYSMPIVLSGPSSSKQFVDIGDNTYYTDAVAWAVEEGITSGTTATTFSPDAFCTRAQAVTFLWRAAGSPAPKSSFMPFGDVSADAYYYDAVLWAVEQGITQGTTTTTFSPNVICTRAQIVTFLWRAGGSATAATANTFTDVAANAYYAEAVNWAVENGITRGTTDTTFSPSENCTRAQIVTFLYRYIAK